jgi:hypothetical protein
VKNKNEEIALLNSDIVSNKDHKKNDFKTTNINILLNRVRLDKKRDIRKKLILFILFSLAIISLIIYLIN